MLIKCFLPELSHPAQYEHKDLLILLPYKPTPFRYFPNPIIHVCTYKSNTFYRIYILSIIIFQSFPT